MSTELLETLPQPDAVELPDDVRWEVAPRWRDVLLKNGRLPLARWLADGDAQVIKHGSHRTVYRLALSGGTFYLKHDRSTSWWHTGRNLIRPSAARREYSKAVELARREVPTVRPVAVGERVRGGLVTDSFLVTEAIDHAVTLGQYISRHLRPLPPSDQSAAWLALADRLARLCAAAHRAGVDHDDLHQGNVLARRGSNSGAAFPELFFVDVPGVRLSGPLDWSRSRASLVMLNSDFMDEAPARVRWRFLRTYLTERPDLPLPDPRSAAEDIIRRTRTYAREILRGRDKRPLRNNREFYRLEAADRVAHVVVGVDPEAVARLLADPETPLHCNVQRPVKLSHTSLLVEAELFAGPAPVAVAYKRTRPSGWWKSRLAWFRRRRALRAWRLGHALASRGIKTARPLLVIVPRGWLSRCDAYVATVWIEDSQNLHLYGWDLARRPAAERTRRARQAAAAMGNLIGRMHAWQISHRDLKGCNILLGERPGSVDAYLLDTDAVRVLRRLSHARRVRDLARIAASVVAHPWVTRTDRMRFMRAYARQLLPEQVDWQRLWRDVERQTAAIVKRLRRRGQPVA